ncbi:hypothetical protein [Methylobrevis albus]|uniref:SMODS and SLOG-associating 2TM effector domain-containing protein n=1 Tax=Methylobrevis albus TaxID=2793297 RepID=A0A931I451_9HYPH|nr:hypothetical protein [Methylobrevis albus]MBH0239119.1 hypothetical protein [Methylobrevis albus]
MEQIRAKVEESFTKANTGAKAWSTAYHTILGAAGIVGIIASLVSGAGITGDILGMSSKTFIAVLSALAAMLTFIGGFGGFEKKWISNRQLRHDLNMIKVDMDANDADEKTIRTKYKEAMSRHESIFVGDSI